MDLEEKIIELRKKSCKTVKEERIIDILNVLLVDKVDNVDELVELTSTTLKTIKKYVYEEDYIGRFLTKEEYEILKTRFEQLIKKNEKEKEAEKNDGLMLSKIIDDIFSSRNRYEDILRNNACSREAFEKRMQQNILEELFGEGITKKIKEKISLNSIERMQVPRNMILIENKNQVSIVKKDIYYTDSFGMKKLNCGVLYLENYDIDLVAQILEIDVKNVIARLEDLLNLHILEETVQKKLSYLLMLEKVLIDSNIEKRIDFLQIIVNSLNTIGIEETSLKYKLPMPFLNRIIIICKKHPYFNDKLKLSEDELTNEKRK